MRYHHLNNNNLIAPNLLRDDALHLIVFLVMCMLSLSGQQVQATSLLVATSFPASDMQVEGLVRSLDAESAAELALAEADVAADLVEAHLLAANSHNKPAATPRDESNELHSSAATVTTSTLTSALNATSIVATSSADLSALSLSRSTNETTPNSAHALPQTQTQQENSKHPKGSSSNNDGYKQQPTTAPPHGANGTTYQQIGSQKITYKSAVQQTATTMATVTTNNSNANTNSKSITRTSAKKVESKYILPKPQKTDAPMLNYIFDTYSSANKHHHHDQRYGPHFEDVQRVGQPTNMTVQAGSSIHLNCRISLLQDKTVSWVRRNSHGENALDLLTVGLHAYTGDDRYKMEFQYPNNWRLKINNVKKDDEAMYECQISTHPPRVIQINLHVNAPKVMIVDEFGDPLQEKYYEIDSTLQLSCVVRNVAMTSSVVFWKHGADILNYDVTRGGVSVKTELMDDGANSTLFIAKINKADSGNYTCSISDFQNFTIVVHILNGESFAELHHGAAGTPHVSNIHHIIAFNLILLMLLLCLPPMRIFR